MDTAKWDLRFLGLAEHVATWSKDPRKQMGCVIADSNNRVVSLGYNGFPRGVLDTLQRYQDRETKLAIVLHAEVNAIMFANRSLEGCSLYVNSMLPCSRCAGQIIQSGIARVVSHKPTEDRYEHWGPAMNLALEMFTEAGVEVVVYDGGESLLLETPLPPTIPSEPPIEKDKPFSKVLAKFRMYNRTRRRGE